MPRWDFHARYALLTYSQCPIPKETAIADIWGKPTREPNYVIVGHELHQDGGDHLHVFIDFGRKFRSRNERFFDLEDEEGTVFHPNWQSSYSVQGSLDYVRKEGDTVERGTAPSSGEARGLSKRDSLWADLLAEATDPEQFLQLVRQRAPYDFATKYDQLTKMARTVFPRKWVYETPYTSDDFSIPDEIQNWVDTQFNPEVRLSHLALRAYRWYLEPAHAGPLSLLSGVN